MFDFGSITSNCENCQQHNDISLNYFIDSDCRLKDSVIARCRSCNTDYIVTLGEPKIQQSYSIKSLLLRTKTASFDSGIQEILYSIKRWPPVSGRPFLFMVRFCTVQLREVSIQSLRYTTYNSIEGFDKLTTIKDLLWQAGLRQSSSKPPKYRKTYPTASTSRTVGFFFKPDS